MKTISTWVLLVGLAIPFCDSFSQETKPPPAATPTPSATSAQPGEQVGTLANEIIEGVKDKVETAVIQNTLDGVSKGNTAYDVTQTAIDGLKNKDPDLKAIDKLYNQAPPNSTDRIVLNDLYKNIANGNAEQQKNARDTLQYYIERKKQANPSSSSGGTPAPKPVLDKSGGPLVVGENGAPLPIQLPGPANSLVTTPSANPTASAVGTTPVPPTSSGGGAPSGAESRPYNILHPEDTHVPDHPDAINAAVGPEPPAPPEDPEYQKPFPPSYEQIRTKMEILQRKADEARLARLNTTDTEERNKKQRDIDSYNRSLTYLTRYIGPDGPYLNEYNRTEAQRQISEYNAKWGTPPSDSAQAPDIEDGRNPDIDPSLFDRWAKEKDVQKPGAGEDGGSVKIEGTRVGGDQSGKEKKDRTDFAGRPGEHANNPEATMNTGEVEDPFARAETTIKQVDGTVKGVKNIKTQIDNWDPGHGSHGTPSGHGGDDWSGGEHPPTGETPTSPGPDTWGPEETSGTGHGGSSQPAKPAQPPTTTTTGAGGKGGGQSYDYKMICAKCCHVWSQSTQDPSNDSPGNCPACGASGSEQHWQCVSPPERSWDVGGPDVSHCTEGGSGTPPARPMPTDPGSSGEGGGTVEGSGTAM